MYEHFEKDAAPLVTRDNALVVRGIDEEKRTADFIASTEAIDSFEEVVEQSWILDRFKGNPVILFGHNSRALPIGQATRCEVVQTIGGPQLECTILFATGEMNPEAERVWQLVKGKFLRAVSVGFYPKSMRYEKRDGKDIFILSENVLHEISVVTIPANPEALAKGELDPLATMKAKAMASANENPVEERATGVSPPTPTPAHESGTENAMNEKEMKAAIDLANEKAAEASRQAEKAAADLAAAEALVTTKDAELAANRSTGATQRAAIDSMSKALGGPKAKLDEKGAPVLDEKGHPVLESHVEMAERIATEIVERDVESLVGVKLTPAQKSDFVALAKKDRGTFDSIVKGLPDLKIMGQVLPAAKAHASTASASDNGEEFAALLGDGATKDAGDIASDFGDMLADDAD
jgi:HK97 family phage prohead protease